jgi:hypothetical protein
MLGKNAGLLSDNRRLLREQRKARNDKSRTIKGAAFVIASCKADQMKGTRGTPPQAVSMRPARRRRAMRTIVIRSDRCISSPDSPPSRGAILRGPDRIA